jgi:cell division protein FtsW
MRAGSKRKRPVTLAEQVLVIATMALVAFGVVMVYSASSGYALDVHGNSLYFLEREGAYAVAGLLALAVCARIDYRVIGRLSPALVAGSGLLLVMVLGAGVTVNGARRWLPVGAGFTIQPSEIAKVALCVFSAWTLSSRKRPPQTVKEAFAPVGGVLCILLLLVMAGSDLGSALCLVLVAAAVLTVSGTRAGVLGRLAAFAGGGIVLMIIVEPYRMQRFTTFLDPWKHSQDSGYQIVQSMMGFGAGGLTGVGLGQSVQKFGYLPEAHTDLILAIVGEELGLLGTLAVVAGFTAVAWAGFSIALAAKDPFGQRLAAGMTALVVGQAVLNFGGVLGVLPLTGVPVPFVSFGGTSLIVTLAGIGTVLSVAAHDRVVAAKAAPAARPRSRTHARSRPAPASARRAAGGRR